MMMIARDDDDFRTLFADVRSLTRVPTTTTIIIIIIIIISKAADLLNNSRAQRSFACAIVVSLSKASTARPTDGGSFKLLLLFFLYTLFLLMPLLYLSGIKLLCQSVCLNS